MFKKVTLSLLTVIYTTDNLPLHPQIRASDRLRQKREILQHFQGKLCGKKGPFCGKLCGSFKADLTLFY